MQSTTILNPSNFPEYESLYDWRVFLKKELLKKRGYKSDYSGTPITRYVGVELHEGILTRANVYKGIYWSKMIYHEYNCFLLLQSEHIFRPPSRAWCIQKSYELYGREIVREWYYSLPFKAFPFQLP